MTDEYVWTKQQPTVWNPEINDTIIGEYLECETVNKSHLYAIKTSDQGVLKVWGSKILDDLMKPISPKTMVKIVYLGMVNPESGNPYHNWEVYQGTKT